MKITIFYIYIEILPSGNPPTTYINASMITLSDCKQRFIATQAPKEEISFQNFWQMILEKKVRVMVMITALKEKNKKKADQYWPESETGALYIGGGITLEHKSTSYQGTFYHRSDHTEPFFILELISTFLLPQSDRC